MRYNPDLYSTAPIQGHSLREWVERAYLLYTNPDAQNGSFDDFIRFALCSQYVENNAEMRAYIDAAQNSCVNLPNPGIEVLRDYDSLIGICDDIHVTTDINMHSVPHANHALKTSVHIKHPVVDDGAQTFVNLHRIPNFSFATFGTRHELFFFFPRLYDKGRARGIKPWKLTDTERSLFYEHGIRPAIASLLGQEAADEWPTSVANEQFRAHRSSGGYGYGTKLFPSYAVSRLAEVIRNLLIGNLDLEDGDRDWAAHFFVLHDIKGVKTVSRHQPFPEEAHASLVDFLTQNHIDSEILNENDGWNTGT
ncbi:hypothetical protein H0H93_012464, partial [Arthromyces matolae]